MRTAALKNSIVRHVRAQEKGAPVSLTVNIMNHKRVTSLPTEFSPGSRLTTDYDERQKT